MVYHGSISEFQPNSEDWVSYIERLQYYFQANDIADENDKKRAILLTACGLPTLKLIKGLVGSDKVQTLTYNEIVKAVTDFYVPTPSPIVQRFHFNSHVRKQNETIAQFVAALRQLSEDCGYGATLEDMIRDRLVCGVNHEGIQRKLLSEKDLTYKRAFELATAVEAAKRNSKELQSQTKLQSSNSATESVLYTSHHRRSSTSKSSARSPSSSKTATSDPPTRGGYQQHVTCYRCGGHRTVDLKRLFVDFARKKVTFIQCAGLN